MPWYIKQPDLKNDPRYLEPKVEELMTHMDLKATLQQEGHTKLSSATDSDDVSTAATPKAVKMAYERAERAQEESLPVDFFGANIALHSGNFESLGIGKIAEGIYAGDGTSLREIVVGFQPKLVVMFFAEMGGKLTVISRDGTLRITPSSPTYMNKGTNTLTTTLNGFQVGSWSYWNGTSSSNETTNGSSSSYRWTAIG